MIPENQPYTIPTYPTYRPPVVLATPDSAVAGEPKVLGHVGHK